MCTEVKQCLLCGSARTTKFKYRSNLSGEGEACRLYHEVRDFQILVEDIIPVQRIYLSRRYNTFGPATIAKIPGEILVEIFMHARQLSSFAYPHLQVVLSSVCSRWRELIHSTPFFWNHLNLLFWKHSRSHIDSRIGLARLYLRHSGTAPLYLKLRYNEYFWKLPLDLRSVLIDPSIDHILIANLHRIKLLHLEDAPLAWLIYTPRISGIESFKFEPRLGLGSNTPVISFANSPHLSDLSLTNWSVIDFGSGDFTQLTTINLKSMELIACVCLLASCPNLVEYRCQTPRHPTISSSFSYQPWKTMVTLEHLKVFEWEMTAHDDLAAVERAMFQFLRLPALLSLQLHTFQHCRHPSVHLFCKRLPKSLSALNISFICADETADVCLINSFPLECQVKTLTLFSRGCLRFLAHTFKAMEDTKLFPQLTHMVVDDNNQGRDRLGRRYELDAGYASLIHKALIQRAKKKKPCIPGFSLEFVWFTVGWPKEVVQGLWQLTRCGNFGLTIRENTNPFSDLPCSYHAQV